MALSTLALWTALGFSLLCGALADDLVIEPEDAHFPYRGNLTVMCRSKTPLTRCQFRINHWRSSYSLMDFDQGVNSEVYSQADDDGKLRYTGKYAGTTLKDGQCGLLLTDMFWGRYVVGCRARTAQGGWKKALMTFRAGNPAKFNMTLTPSKAYVTPGSNVDVLCAADRPLKECSVVVQREDDYVRFHEGTKSEATPFYRYFGTGLENGQCGVTLLKVTEEDNGPVWCWGEEAGARGTARAAIITVISPPALPELTLSSDNKYAAGAKISAVCTVKAGRPVASITWLVGNEIVRKDAEDDVPSETWAWPWDEQIITQKLVLTLKKEYVGKDLVCRVNHPALKQASQVAKRIGEESSEPSSGSSPSKASLISSPSKANLVSRATKAGLVITPEVAKFPYRGNLTVMCQSDVPVTNCEFSVNSWRTNYPPMNFNKGPQSEPYTTKGSDRRLKFKAAYYGTGLENGQCGLLLSDVYWGRYIVGCRVRGEKGGWRQAVMTVTSGQAEPFGFEIDPGQAVVLPGSDVNVLCRADGPLSSCYIDTQSQEKEIYFSEGAQSIASTIHYQYNGQGLQAGHCGVTLFSVSPVDNGPVWCWGEQNGTRGTAMASIVTVASAPSSPELAFTSGAGYAEGSTLSAVCTVRGSRPVAGITWLVGGEVVRKDDVDDAPITEWKWPWDEQSITQKLTLKVKKEYIGKDVVCQVDHQMLKEPIKSAKKILPGDASRVSAALTEPSETSVVIEPEDAHFPYRGNLTIMCTSKAPLKRCQFSINHWKVNFPPIDFDRGSRSSITNATDAEGKLRYSGQYVGTGLENGQCGMLLSDVFWGRYVVGCRVQGAKGGWKQALMTFRSGNPAKFGMTLTPTRADVTPGSNVDVLCAADRPLKECSVVVQREDDYVRFHEGTKSEATPFYRYFGTGLENGQCGVTLLKVTEEDNGPVWCWGEEAGARGTARAAIITVITPPEAPELVVTSRKALDAGKTLTAICTVRGSRPVSSITWLVGKEVVRADADDDLIPENWVWPWDKQAIIQKLSITLKSAHVGKMITCRVDHIALKQSLEVSQKI